VGEGLSFELLSFCFSQGRNQRKISGGAKVTFGNDYDVIDVQSTMMRPFCYDRLTNQKRANDHKFRKA